jgi:hypothetical protein
LSPTTSATLSFIDERQFLTTILPVLPFHECADLALAESAADPAPIESMTVVDPTLAMSSAGPLHSTTGATSAETT